MQIKKTIDHKRNKHENKKQKKARADCHRHRHNTTMTSGKKKKTHDVEKKIKHDTLCWSDTSGVSAHPYEGARLPRWLPGRPPSAGPDVAYV